MVKVTLGSTGITVNKNGYVAVTIVWRTANPEN